MVSPLLLWGCSRREMGMEKGNGIKEGKSVGKKGHEKEKKRKDTNSY